MDIFPPTNKRNVYYYEMRINGCKSAVYLIEKINLENCYEKSIKMYAINSQPVTNSTTEQRLNTEFS